MALLPDEATAADIPVVIPDAGGRITRACAVLLELSIDTSGGHYYRLSRRAGGR